MAIPYIVRRKVFMVDREKKELWYAVAKPIQKRGGITEEDIVKRVSGRTGFSAGEIQGIITDVIEAIEFFLKLGYTVNMKNLGSFQTSLTSNGFENPTEITPGEVKLSRIYYVADRKLTTRVREAGTFKIPLRTYMPPEYWEEEDTEEIQP